VDSSDLPEETPAVSATLPHIPPNDLAEQSLFTISQHLLILYYLNQGSPSQLQFDKDYKISIRIALSHFGSVSARLPS
jgi:hypothetical protein